MARVTWYDDDGEMASAFKKRGIDVTPDAIYLARVEAGLEFPISELDLRAKIEPCLRRLAGPAATKARATPEVKAIMQSFGDGERRCQRNKATAQQARRDLFRQSDPPFPNIAGARRWIESQRRQMGPPHVHHYEADGEEAWWKEMLTWPGENLWVVGCPVDKDGPLARLAKWSKLLAGKAGITEAQATAYILCGSIVGADSPVKLTLHFAGTRPARVGVAAEAYVPQNIVARARAWGLRIVQPSRKRSRPGRR